MAKSQKQIKAATDIKALSDNKKIAILHELLGIITDESELKALSDDDGIQYWLSIEKFKTEFEDSTRELLDTLDSSLFPSDAIHKIATHFFKCIIDAAGGLNNRAWFGDEMSGIRKQLFINLLGISDDPIHVESCRVYKEKSILNTKQPIQIKIN